MAGCDVFLNLLFPIAQDGKGADWVSALLAATNPLPKWSRRTDQSRIAVRVCRFVLLGG